MLGREWATGYGDATQVESADSVTNCRAGGFGLLWYSTTSLPSHKLAANSELKWAIGNLCTAGPRDRKQQVQDR
jgi:hypothetical protein